MIGLGSMIGAGIFAALAPAAREAHGALLAALAVAAAVAYCNAMSSARLAARYPESGGTYVYGRRRLGAWWGYMAGWGFVVGKIASCAAMGLTLGTYAAPGAERPIAVAAVVALTVLNLRGVQRTAGATRVIVALVLAILAAVVVAALTSGHADPHRVWSTAGVTPRGLLGAAGILFFAFAGYARIATMGEEVVDPARTIPRAILLALAITLVVYATVTTAALAVLGPSALAVATAPLAATVRAAGADGLTPFVRAGAALASAGVLVSLLAGVSRTVLAMARDDELPRALAAVDPMYKVPYRAQVTIGVIVVALVLASDLRGVIGFSSFTVLVYYAIANASAWTLGRRERPAAALGLVGCAALALSLPWTSVAAGAGVLAVGALVRLVRIGVSSRSRANRT